MRVRWIGLGEFIGKLNKDKIAFVSQKLDQIGNVVFSSIKEEAPSLTGRLIKTLWLKKKGNLTREIWENSPYGIFVREDTKAHPIFPVKKKALYWPGIRGGRPVASVWHPGTEANPYHVRGVENAMPEIDPIMVDLGMNIVADLAR